jgi:hypothetical protein
MRINDVKNGAHAKGQTSLLKYLNGERLTQRQAILAKCYECMGGYGDGRQGCGIEDCPLYPYAPYKKGEQDEQEDLAEQEDADTACS